MKLEKSQVVAKDNRKFLLSPSGSTASSMLFIRRHPGSGWNRLQTVAGQLCEVITYISNLSLRLERLPILWKTSCVVPVPKTTYQRFRHLNTWLHTWWKPWRGSYLAHDSGGMPTYCSLPTSWRSRWMIGPPLSCREPGALWDSGYFINTIQPSVLRGKLEGAGCSIRCPCGLLTTSPVDPSM